MPPDCPRINIWNSSTTLNLWEIRVFLERHLWSSRATQIGVCVWSVELCPLPLLLYRTLGRSSQTDQG